VASVGVPKPDVSVGPGLIARIYADGKGVSVHLDVEQQAERYSSHGRLRPSATNGEPDLAELVELL